MAITDGLKIEHCANYQISLSKILDKKVVDILGYVSMEFGFPVFKIGQLVLEDGTKIDIEGEHDFPYVPSGTGDSFEEIMQTIVDDEAEEDIEDD